MVPSLPATRSNQSPPGSRRPPRGRPVAKRPLLPLCDPPKGRVSPVCVWVGVGVAGFDVSPLNRNAKRRSVSGLHRVHGQASSRIACCTPESSARVGDPRRRARVWIETPDARPTDLSFVVVTALVPHGPPSSIRSPNAMGPGSIDQARAKDRKAPTRAEAGRRAWARLLPAGRVYVELGPDLRRPWLGRAWLKGPEFEAQPPRPMIGRR